jgi:hypothetical protein
MNIKKKLPPDFDISMYKELNNDLKNMNENQLLNHYLLHGQNENRIYKITLPDDIDLYTYRELNNDLNNLNETQLKIHYFLYGQYENREYKCKFPNEFDINNYRELNKDLYNLNDKELSNHYYNFGQYENRMYKKITYNKNLLENNINIKSISINNNHKISIIMTYYNRKEQIIMTLNQFQLLNYDKYNIEIIIVDDLSNNDNDLKDIIKKYNFYIKLIKLKNKKWINSCIPNNIGLSHSTGDIIILQNAEIFHCDDLIKQSIYLLDNDEKYYTFPVFSSPSFEHNNKIKDLMNNTKIRYYKKFINNINYTDYDFDYLYYKTHYDDIKDLSYEEAYKNWLSYGIKNKRKCNESNIYYPKQITQNWKGWYNHYMYNNRNLHFLVTFKRSLLDKIGGFCNELKDGLWFEDNEFINRISKVIEIETIHTNKYLGIHLYHENGSSDSNNIINFEKLTEKNKEIFKKNIKNNVIYCDIKLNNINCDIVENNI